MDRARRPLLIVLTLFCATMILACTGAADKWIDLPGGHEIWRDDHYAYGFQGTGLKQIEGHITHVAFNDRFILIRRDQCKHIGHNSHELTGIIEHYIIEVSPPKLHGPFKETKIEAERRRLGVPPQLVLETVDEVRDRLGPRRSRIDLSFASIPVCRSHFLVAFKGHLRSSWNRFRSSHGEPVFINPSRGAPG